MSSKARISRRTAVVATALAAFATPAFASLVIQSYMKADISLADNCLITQAGTDVTNYSTADGPNAAFATGDMGGSPRVTFEEDTLSVRGMDGDRVIYTDVARIQNTCDVPLRVSLTIEGAQTGDWTDRYAEVYLSSVPTAFGATTALGYPTDTSGNWITNPISVDSTGTPVGTTSTEVVVPADQELRVATLIEAGTGSNLAATSNMSWEVTAINGA